MSKSITQRFLAIFTSNIIGILATFLATPLIVRFLGSARYGDYAFLLSILSISLLFANSGIYDGIRKHIKESNDFDAWEDRVFAFYSHMGLVTILSIGLAISVGIHTGLVQQYFGSRFEQYFVLIFLIIISEQGFVIARSTLMGFDREDISEKLVISNNVGSVSIGLVLLYLGYGVPGLIAGRLLSNAVLAGIGLIIVSRFIDYSHLFVGPSARFPGRRLLSFNVMSILLFSLYVSIQQVDIILIQIFHGSTLTGYYKAALTLAEFVWFVPRIVQISLLHSTSELWSKSKHDTITEISSKVTRYSLLFTLLLVIGLSALAEQTVTVYYGSEFKPAVLPLIILLPGAVGFAVARPILAIGQGKGDFRYLIYATGAASILNLVLNLLLIPQFGIIGAAVATSIGYFSMFLFHVFGARKIGFDPISDLRLRKVSVTIVLATGGIYILATIIQSDSLSIVIVPPVGFVLYAAVAVATGAISIDELQKLRNQIPT